MGWIKKGNVVSLAAAAGLLWLLAFLFLDALAKRTLISAAQAVFQAKVDVSSVDVRLLKGALRIEGFAAADKSEPMKNLIEFREARFAFKPSAALRGKLVIREASLEGLLFGTPRKKSGALSRPRKPSALESLAHRALGSEEGQAALSRLSEAKSALKDIEPSRLKSLAGLDETQRQIDEVAARWKEKAAVFQALDKDVASIQAGLKELSAGAASAADVARKLQALQQAQSKLKALRDQVQSARRDLDSDLALVQGSLKKAEELKKRDLDGLLSAAGLPSLDAESLGKRLLGPLLAQRVGSALYWINWAKTRSAGAAAEKTPERPRRAGVTIAFPAPGADPSFLLEQASLSGRLASAVNGQNLDLSGTLSGVASDPPLYGKPARLKLAGAVPNGPQLVLNGVWDQTLPQRSAASLSFDYNGMPLSGLALGDGEIGALVSAGSGRLKGNIRSEGELWKGEILLQASGLALDPRLGLSGEAQRLAAGALRGVKSFSARVGIEGTEDDLRLTFSSDLGRTLAEALKGAFSAELSAQRKALEAKLDALYRDKAKDLQAQAARLQSQLLAPLEAQQGLVEKALKEAAGKSLGNPLERLKGLFR